MKEELIQKYYNRLKNLKQYQEISKEELLRLAEKKANEELANIDNLVTDPIERKLAKKLLSKYLDEFDVDNIADRNTVGREQSLEGKSYRVIHETFTCFSSANKDSNRVRYSATKLYLLKRLSWQESTKQCSTLERNA